MKNILSILTFFLIYNYSYAQKIDTENKQIFREVIEAYYFVKQVGELTREDAFIEELFRKEIYNEKGFLIESWILTKLNFEKTELSKNENGKLIKSSTFDSKGGLKEYTTTEFDKNGNIIFLRNFNSKDELTFMDKNQYDSNANIVSISTTYFEKSKKIRKVKTRKKYNSKNQLIEETYLNSDGTIIDIRTYKYENGNEVECISISNEEYTKFISEYDENNNIIVHKWYDKEGNKTNQTSFTYAYDNQENWITRKIYLNGELDNVSERKIEYNRFRNDQIGYEFSELERGIKKMNNYISRRDYNHIDIESLINSTGKKLTKYLHTKELTKKESDSLGLKLAINSIEHNSLKIYNFGYDSGGSRGYLTYPVIQWKNSENKLFSYNFSKNINCDFYKVHKLNHKFKDLFLLIGRESGDGGCSQNMVYCIEIKGDYLIIDNPVFINRPYLNLCNIEFEFNEEKQELIGKELDGSNRIRSNIENMREYSKSEINNQKLIDLLVDDSSDKNYIKLLFNGHRFVKK